MTSHTPTPWEIAPSTSTDLTLICGAKNFRVAAAGHSENAVFIVKACNAYDDLVYALEESRDSVKSAWGMDEKEFKETHLAKIIDSALAKGE